MIILIIILAVIFVLSSFLLQVILHELGHLIFGVITGWKLIYIQIWKLIIYHDKKKYKMKHIPCKGFMCIMKPTNINCRSYGYTLGGLISNLLFTILTLVAMIKVYNSLYIFLFLLSFSLAGIALLITNGIPKVSNLCNDMACFLLIKGNGVTRHYHNTQLIIANELVQGRTYSRMKEDLFIQEQNIEINDITAYSFILNYYFHLDKDEFRTALRELLKINDLSKISSNMLRIYKLEMFFLYMVMLLYGCEPFMSSLLPERETEMYYLKENAITGDVHSLRVLIMYQAYCAMNKNEINDAIEILERGVIEIKNTSCVYLGEKLFCIDQLEAACNMLKRMTLSNMTSLI